MKINKVDGKLRVCLTPKEMALLLVSDFFVNLTEEINKGTADEENIKKQIKNLANKSVDSHDYEYFAAILDLYEQFKKNCELCFNLKPSFDYKTDSVKTLKDLTKYKDDPPDVIILYKENYFEFELKRYRGDLTVDSIYKFLREKIILHYSGHQNYLILIQSPPNTELSLDIFKKVHERLIKEKNDSGIIGFSLNNGSKEMILIRILPKLDFSKRAYETESDRFAELLHSE